MIQESKDFIKKVEQLNKMTNDKLPETPQERIKADAERYTKDEGYQKAYIAGATAENERGQYITDRLGIALENVYNIHSDQWTEFDRKEIKGILQQWNGAGKEVEQTDEEKYKQWIKENVTVLGEFDFIVGQKRIHGKRTLREVYNYLTNPPK